MVQSLYGEVAQSHLTYTKAAQGSNVLNQANPNSNINPSIITFQKDPRSGVIESGISYQQARGIDLDRIDQQLELSRKMFPN
jgi:hypothetical protein